MAKRCQAILTDRSQHGYRFASKPGGSSFRAVGKCLLELLSNPEFWALNSAVECHLHTVEVIGSNPIAPTIFSNPYRASYKGFASLYVTSSSVRSNVRKASHKSSTTARCDSRWFPLSSSSR